MSRIRGAVLVVCMLVVSSIAAASALAALPEFDGPFPNHFTALQLGKGTLLTVGPSPSREVSCEHGAALGFVNGAKDVLVNSITYKECKSTKFGGGKCQSGATKGEIVTLQLLGLLGYINKATKLVGLLFESHGSTNHFASFLCETLLGEEHLTVRGTVICDLQTAGIVTNEFHLGCKQTNGMPEPLNFEGQGKMFLTTEGTGPENFAAEESGVTALSDISIATATLILA